MEILKNFDKNLFDLISDAHKWEYTNINDNEESSLSKKPKYFFTNFQWAMIIIAFFCSIISKDGINADFAGYIITGMSLFVGLLFTLAVSLFDKFNNINFEKYKQSINKDLYPFGIRLKNFFKKAIILTLYTSIIALVCILMLTFILLYKPMSISLDFIKFITEINKYTFIFILKVLLLITYRSILFYFLLNFIYITKNLITYFYDYMVSEIKNINLK